MIYANPGSEGSVVSFKPKYENFIGGKWVAPVKGNYFTNTTPVTGEAPLLPVKQFVKFHVQVLKILN